MCNKLKRSQKILLLIIVGILVCYTNLSYASENLVKAVKSGDMAAVKDLIKSGEDVNASNSHGTTPLIQAIASEHEDIIKFLLEKGTDPNISGKKEGGSYEYSPLTLAFEIKNNKNIIQLLLSKPIDCDYQGEYSGSHLHEALSSHKKSNFDIEYAVNRLLKNGCDVNVKDKNGSTPIFYSQSYKDFQLLVQHGAKLDVINNEGQNLYFVIGSPGIGSYLKKNTRLDINKKDNKRNTPIFFAKDTEYIKFLIKNGAAPYHINQEGDAPIFSIFDRGGDYVTLIKSGVDVNRAYGEKQTTFAHHIMKVIDDKIKSYNQAQAPVYSIGNSNLDALFLLSAYSTQSGR